MESLIDRVLGGEDPAEVVSDTLESAKSNFVRRLIGQGALKKVGGKLVRSKKEKKKRGSY